jgi:hypothetical protein
MSEKKAGADQPMTKQAFLIRSELKVREGEDFLERYIKVNQEIVDIVLKFEPQMISFVQFFDKDKTKVTGIQLHPSAESLEFHMKTITEQMDTALLSLEYIELAIYGPSSPGVDAFLEKIEAQGVKVDRWPIMLNGFSRFTVPPDWHKSVNQLAASRD